MIRAVRLTAAAFLALAVLAAGPLPAQPLPADTEMAPLIRARLDAAGRGSAQDWARYVADECLCGSETKAQIQHGIETRLPTVKNWYGEISDLQVLPLGDAAVARYVGGLSKQGLDLHKSIETSKSRSTNSAG